MATDGEQGSFDREVAQLFALVSEALAGATDALLAAEPAAASRVVAADESVDELTAELSRRIWEDFDRLAPASAELRHLVGLLAVLPELERSADLAAHIAQRAVTHLGPSMSPVSRGIVQRMSDVGLEMWRSVAASYILLERLTSEVATSAMPAQVAAQVTLLGRFYERLGDHAVNLARRIELLPGVNTDGTND
jgi:phosphate transport system protein